METKQPTVVVERIIRSTAYARNGNAHRPTNYYGWVVYIDGVQFGMFARRGDAQDALPAMLAEHAERKAKRDAMAK